MGLTKYLAVFATTSILSLVALAATTVGAQAVSVLPDAFSSVSCTTGPATATDADGCSLQIANPLTTASAHVSYLDTVASLGVGATFCNYSCPSYYGASANASLTYYFQVLGGEAGTPVPIIISVDLNAGPVNFSVVYYAGSASVSAAGVQVGRSAGGLGFLTPQFSGDFSTMVNSGEAQEVQLNVAGGAFGIIGGGGSAFAGASIFIDPTFADAGNYTVQFSQGIGPVTGWVPEPATWAMFLIGFGAVGFSIRRKTTTAMAS